VKRAKLTICKFFGLRITKISIMLVRKEAISMKRWGILVVFLVCLNAHAYGSIIGDTVRIDWMWPSFGSLQNSIMTTVVDPGIEWNAGSFVYIDIKDGFITIENRGASWATQSGWADSNGFNGFVFEDWTKNPNFTSFSLVSIGGYPPPVDPILFFDENLLLVNFNASSADNMGEGKGQLYTFAYTTGAVPEPATMLLLGSGLLSLFGLRRKFRK